jgi:hypothetical protein
VMKQPINHGRPEFSKRPNGLTDEALCDLEFMVTRSVEARLCCKRNFASDQTAR